MAWRSDKRGSLWRTAWLGASVATLVGGCVAGVPVDSPKVASACQCSPPQPCPTSVCDVQIDVSAKTCGGEVSEVEVLIGDELEPVAFVPGEPKRTCATIPRGSTRMLRARADSRWQWQEEVACPPAAAGDTIGPTVVRVLNCVAAQP